MHGWADGPPCLKTALNLSYELYACITMIFQVPLLSPYLLPGEQLTSAATPMSRYSRTTVQMQGCHCRSRDLSSLETRLRHSRSRAQTCHFIGLWIWICIDSEPRFLGQKFWILSKPLVEYAKGFLWVLPRYFSVFRVGSYRGITEKVFPVLPLGPPA